MLNTKSIGLVAVINAFSTVLGLLYSVVLARYFGIGTSIEVYFASTTLLFMINSLTQSGQLAEIAMPIYHKFLSTEGQESANRVMSVIFNWMGLIAVGFALGSFLGAPWLFYWSASGFEKAQLEEGVLIFRIISPLLFIEIMKSQITSMVNAEKRFGKIEWVNILNQVTSMAFIIFLSGTFQVYAVVMGLWVGELLAIGYGIYVLSKTNFRYHFILRHTGFEVSSVLKNMSYTFAYVLISQAYLFYLNNLLTHLPKGLYAVYKYASLIFVKLQGLLIRPVSTIFFSQFSSAFHAGSTKLKQLVEETTSLSFVLSAFVFSGIMAAGHPMLRLLWEGEKFTSDAILKVYETMTIVSFCMFFNAMALIYRKIVMTLGKIKEQYLSYIAVQMASIAILYVFRNHVSLESILVLILLNTLLLSAVPVVISHFHTAIKIPINIGVKSGSNFLFFIGLCLFGWSMEWITQNIDFFQSPFLAFGFSAILFSMLSLAAAFALGLTELRFVRAIQNRISTLF